MRADAAQADRRHAVRTAAAAWRRAGAIDDATQRTIGAAYPDDRVRLGLGLRVLAGGAGLIGGGALAGLLYSIFGGSDAGAAFGLFLAVVFVAATELQTGRLRRADAGAELATAILAVGFACGWIAAIDLDASVIVFAGCALMAALAAWRWGHASLAAVAAFLALLSAGQSPFGRILWLAAGAVAIPMIVGLARSPRLPPAQRRCSWAAGLVGLAGGYVATNLYSLDHRWVHWLGDGGDPEPAAWARIAAIAGTIVIPPFVFAAGLRYRDRALLAAGAVFAAASLVTLRHYHRIGPWWLSLVLGGIACLGIAVGIRRRLEAGPTHEWAGFTARPLFEDPRLLETAHAAAVLAAMSPAARVAPEAGFSGGGGRSGGGGATGTS